jgi:acid phosphatase type 7
VLAAGAIAVAASATGFASSLALTPRPLTVYVAPSTIPISTCALSAPVADTYADQGSSGSNFGSATELHVRSGTTLLLLAANKRTFVRFDLSSCAVPADARVLSARMKLFMSTAPSATRTYRAHRITGSWAETSLDWVNQPGVAGSPTASVATGATANVPLEWDVLADVGAFVAGSVTNHGWRVSDAIESNTGEGRFSSREHATASRRPSLVVTYYP